MKGVDVVIHCAARAHILSSKELDADFEYEKINVFGSKKLLESSISAGVKKFIFLSSIKAVGERTDGKEPFNPQTHPAPEDAYGRSKLKAELELQKLASSSNVQLIIIRTPLVYGPSVKGNLKKMIDFLKYPIPFPKINNLRSFIGLPNLVDFIVFSSLSKNTIPGIYFVSDNDDKSTYQLVSEIRSSMGVVNIKLPFGAPVVKFLSKGFGLDRQLEKIFGDLIVDVSQTIQITGWHPRFSFEDQIKAMINNKDLYLDEVKKSC